jgi:L-rhamnose mutarotase
MAFFNIVYLSICFIIFVVISKDKAGNPVIERFYFDPIFILFFIIALAFIALFFSMVRQFRVSYEKDRKARQIKMFSIFLNSSKEKKYQSHAIQVANSNFVTKLLRYGICEEWQAVLIDQISQWRNDGLSKNQVKQKETIFMLSLHWGRFLNWVR